MASEAVAAMAQASRSKAVPKFGTVRRQQRQGDVVGDGEGALVVPTVAVAHHDGVRILARVSAKCARNRSMTLALTLGITRVTSSPVSGRTAEKM